MMTAKRNTTFFVVIAALLVIGMVACTSENEMTASTDAQVSVATEQPEQIIGMANPASVYCIEQDGKLEMREELGGTTGYCVFPDGTEKEEWEYWRENHPTAQ